MPRKEIRRGAARTALLRTPGQSRCRSPWSSAAQYTLLSIRGTCTRSYSGEIDVNAIGRLSGRQSTYIVTGNTAPTGPRVLSSRSSQSKTASSIAAGRRCRSFNGPCLPASASKENTLVSGLDRRARELPASKAFLSSWICRLAADFDTWSPVALNRPD